MRIPPVVMPSRDAASASPLLCRRRKSESRELHAVARLSGRDDSAESIFGAANLRSQKQSGLRRLKSACGFHRSNSCSSVSVSANCLELSISGPTSPSPSTRPFFVLNPEIRTQQPKSELRSNPPVTEAPIRTEPVPGSSSWWCRTRSNRLPR